MARIRLLVLLLLAALGTGACLISEQEGERRHVNSAPPERMAFHFDSGLNKGMVWGRSAALVLLGLWLVQAADGSKKLLVAAFGLGPCLGLAGWLLAGGLTTINRYRIDVLPDRLVVQVPPDEERSFPWPEIEELYVEGVSTALNTGIATYETYERMEIRLSEGEAYEVDLRPLSSEQRGTLWQAVVRKAHLVEQ